MVGLRPRGSGVMGFGRGAARPYRWAGMRKPVGLRIVGCLSLFEPVEGWPRRLVDAED